jgi:hypothetical protein
VDLVDDDTRQRLARLERELTILRAQVARRQRRPRARATLLGVALVALLALSPLTAIAANFVDLNPGSGHNPNINAIADAGISLGCVPDGSRYCPNDLVTREQMASFLARTAGLGTNPPVANALTAVTAQTALDAPNAQPKYVRTIVVSPVGIANQNGTALANALAGITDASATNPYLLKIEPGVYNVNFSLTAKPFVDIEGSGEGVTRLVHNEGGNVTLVSDMELRHLYVECSSVALATPCNGIRINSGQTPRLTHVTVRAFSDNFNARALLVDEASPTIENSTLIAEGFGGAVGIRYTGTADTNTLTLRDSTIVIVAATNRLGIEMLEAGSKTIVVEQSRITAATNTVTISGAGNVVRVIASQLAGGATSNSGGTLTCTAAYDENFTFSASTCP